MRIPKSIEAALLKQRKALNKQAEYFNQHSSSSKMRTQSEHLEKELSFWNIDDDTLLDEFIMEELTYALMLEPDSFHWDTLPGGYMPLVKVMEFELGCQNEGWVVVSNIGEDDMVDVIASYKYFGLNDEASALEVVLAKYKQIDESSDDFHTEIGRTYSAVVNKTPELEDRLSQIRNFVRKNSKLFGVA